jgi:SAM-dependent methyltransferase
MNIQGLKQHWNRLGKVDPLWAILTNAEKRGNRWQRYEFFRTGEEEVAMIMRYVRSLGIDLRRSRALDFGCGVGRLTQALGSYFAEVCGVDIAPSMIRLAEKYNRHAGNCKYYLNDRADLKLFDDATFDFIYTSITLQHMEPAYAKAYLKEFLRVLVPGGISVFDLPSEEISPPGGHSEGITNAEHEATKTADHKRLLAETKRILKSLAPAPLLDFYLGRKYPIMEMHAIKREELEGFLETHGARILAVAERQNTPNWITYRYCITNVRHSVV